MTAREVQCISKALSDPRRFEILRRIAKNDCIACSDLKAKFPITAATLSHHLKELESCGLLTMGRRGKFVDLTFCRNVWQEYLKALGGI
jgi:ArsR family transcriptional regulator